MKRALAFLFVLSILSVPFVLGQEALRQYTSLSGMAIITLKGGSGAFGAHSTLLWKNSDSDPMGNAIITATMTDDFWSTFPEGTIKNDESHPFYPAVWYSTLGGQLIFNLEDWGTIFLVPAERTMRDLINATFPRNQRHSIRYVRIVRADDELRVKILTVDFPPGHPQ